MGLAEWSEKYNEDQKRTAFVFFILAAVLIFVFWTQGCFRSFFSTDLSTLSTENGSNISEQTTPVTIAPSLEDRLSMFLSDANTAVNTDTGTWFDFDRINFKVGTAELTEDSEAQLHNVAEVMKHFPQARFKIGGYTDNTGSEDINMKISADRAKIVFEKLLSLGVNANQLTGSEGYGSQHPVADNATDEGRARNRRISVKVVTK